MKHRLLLLAFSALLTQAAAQPTLIKVDRYDDANDYLPGAERRNKAGLRLLLKQQEGEQLFKVVTPRNVSVDVVAQVPEGADLGVVFLLGGNGVLSIVGDRLDRSFSFQPRSRDHWWSQKIATFLVDAPSDRLGKAGIEDPLWRAGPEHATDLKAVLEAISGRFSGDLVLHGHSNGAVSLANAAALRHPKVKGYVLSSASHHRRGTTLIYDVDYAMPVLVVQHRNDTCVSSPTTAFDELQKRLKAPEKTTLWFEGGAEPFSGPCGPFAAHSFVGLEAQVIEQTGSALRQMLKK